MEVLEDVDRSIAVDLRGTWLCMKYEIEAMLAAGGACGGGAREYIGKGIRINSVCPGAIETPRRQRRLAGFTAEQIAAHYADLTARIPAGRVGRADEVAAGIVWLCSDAASYVVGHHLVIDGGLSA